VSAYATIAASNGLSPRTIEWVASSARYLQEFLGNGIPIEQITTHDVRRWMLALRQRRRWQSCRNRKNESLLSATSINNYVRGVKLLLSTLANEELIAPHPVADMSAPKPAKVVIRPFTEQELRRIFRALAGTEHPHRNRAVVGLLFDPGLRLSEAVGLKMADVNLDERSITVLGKGAKQRLLPLGSWTAKLLLLYMTKERLDIGGQFLFIEADGRPLTSHCIQQVLRRLSQRLGIHVHAHRFRHTGAIEYLRSGGDSLFLQQLLGHASLTMTRNYAQIAGVDLKAAHARHSPGDRLRL